MKKIILLVLLCVCTSYAYADNTEWQTLEVDGKYTNSEPPKPDQTFKVQYRIINATLESVEAKDYGITFTANTTDKGILEVMFPRNYPYANFAGREDFYLFINGYGTDAYYLPESTPMMDHVRPKIINDINRPPPHPTTFSEKSDCYFVFYVPFYTFAEIAIGYGSNGLIPSPYYGDDVPQHCIPKTIVGADIAKHPTPLKQFKSGVFATDIICNEGLNLLQKHDGSPACVKPESSLKLVKRGWTVSEGNVNILQSGDEESSKLNDTLKKEFLKELQKTPRIESMYNFTYSACKFVISEMLKNRQVSEIIEDYQYKTSDCSFGMDRSEPSLNRFVAVTFDVIEKQFSATVTYDLKSEDITFVLGPPSKLLE